MAVESFVRDEEPLEDSPLSDDPALFSAFLGRECRSRLFSRLFSRSPRSDDLADRPARRSMLLPLPLLPLRREFGPPSPLPMKHVTTDGLAALEINDGGYILPMILAPVQKISDSQGINKMFI
jgi:hypothetical protein